MAEPIAPPDMVAAGIAQQGQPTEPIRQTTLPQDTISLLRPQPPQGMGGGDLSLLSMLGATQPAPNVGLAAAAGVLDAMKGVRGPNTYLQQHGQMVDQGQARQMQQVQLMDRMMQRRREQEEKQEAALMTIVEGFKDSDNPGAQAIRARYLSGVVKRLGGPDIPLDYFSQAREVSKEKLDSLNLDIFGGLTLEQITAKNPWVAGKPPNWLKDHIQVVRNPAVRAKLGYKSDEELQVEKVERDRTIAEGEIATWRTKHRDIDDKSLPYVAQYVQQYGGMPLIGLDPANPVHQELKTKALAWAREQVKANDTAWQQLEETKRAHRVGESQKERELRIKESEGGGFGKPMSAEATQKITNIVRVGDAVSHIDSIQNDPAKRKIVDNYIGPYASRYATAQTYAPGGIMGQVPPEFVDLQNSLASIRNTVINMYSGAATSEQEMARINRELPNISQPPDQFWRNMELTKQNYARQRKVIDAAIVRGDRRALAVMQEMEGAPPAAPRGPLNPAPAPGGQAGSVMMRSPSGVLGSVPQSRVNEALAKGYTRAK